MLFFQVGLLIGYTYAHLLVSRFRDRPRWQVGIHLGILIVSVLFLPITPAESLKPTGGEGSPVGGIVSLLFFTVGLPYVVISASDPLFAALVWFGNRWETSLPALCHFKFWIAFEPTNLPIVL